MKINCLLIIEKKGEKIKNLHCSNDQLVILEIKKLDVSNQKYGIRLFYFPL